MSHQLAAALRVLADAMRDDEQHTPSDHETPEREPEGGDRPLHTMGYFSQKPANVTQQRTANRADDAPLVPPAVLLAKPDKKAAA